MKPYPKKALTSTTPLIYAFNKPYGVLSQFSPLGDRPTLASFGPFQNNVYPVGRLDADSEGLLLLTNDNQIKHRLLDPKFKHPRTYVTQVERIPSREALEQLRTGVVIQDRRTKPAIATLLNSEPALPPRPNPIRYRKTVPTAWLKLTLIEGKNHQIRRMMAAIDHPCLRLVRIAIGKLTLGTLEPGQSRELKEADILALFDY